MPLRVSNPIVGLSVKSDLPKDTVQALFSGISFASEQAVMHNGDTYSTYSPSDDGVLSSVHRLFGGDLSIAELDRRIHKAALKELCCSEMSQGMRVQLTSSSSEADLSSLAALACASLSQQNCRRLPRAPSRTQDAHRQPPAVYRSAAYGRD